MDYNADLDQRFSGADVLRDGTGYKGMAGLANGKILTDFTFHQLNVWGHIERTLAMLEDKFVLGRPIPWASGYGRLLVLPHAGYDQNAFYDRATGALHFMYFEGPGGEPVYTCLSHDIIAHELGHAVLDGLKPYYNEVSSPETAGFHEYFGDAVAMTASLTNRELALIVTKGGPEKLSARNVVSAIASEFGAATRGVPNEAYLRGAWNRMTMRKLAGTFEEHDWSEVLTGVFYELLQYLYRRNLADIPRGKGPGGAQGRAMQALFRAANQTAGVMFRGLDYCPPVDLRYSEYACAVLASDEAAYPIDGVGAREELKRIFKRRGINPPRRDFDGLPSHPDYYKNYPKARKQKQLSDAVASFAESARRNGLVLHPGFRSLLENNLSNEDRLRYLRELGKKKVAYLARGKAAAAGSWSANIKVHVLAPEPDTSVYYTKDARANALMAAAGVPDRGEGYSWDFPWAQRFAPGMPSSVTDGDFARLRRAIREDGVAAARFIDRAKNNTSLCLLMKVGGKRLLLPGDAELESWEIIHRKCKAHMKPVNFLKVSHHGSHNGTPTDALDAWLPKKNKANAQVLVSTKRNVYGTKNPVPDESLLDELRSRCSRLLTTDGQTGKHVELEV